MKKVLSMTLALCLTFALTACGDTGQPAAETAQTETPLQTEVPVQTETSAASLAGTYHFDYTDVYGDVTGFTVTLKDAGDFHIMTLGALGNGVYSGNEWTDNGDGSFTTGATDNPLEMDWAADDGSITWTIDGGGVTPAGYTAPTEFLDKASFSDPVIGAEAVGVYVFGSVNDHGSTVPYILWVNGDGTYAIHMNNSFTGLHTYTGDSWTINNESIISFGPASFEGDEPMGDWFNGEAGWTSSWNLHGDGTCDPVGYTGASAEVDTSSLPAEIYPDGAEYAGIYTFGSVNDHGSAVPYVIWLNADGTAAIHMNNSFTGLHTYTAEEWISEGDGIISVGPLSYEGDEPMGGWFAEGTFESQWQVNSDGTCTPIGYTGSVAAVDGLTQPVEIYPRYHSAEGVYYFGSVNDHGSTVPYALILNSDGGCAIVMDNSFTGVHSYTGQWADNGDGTVSVGALTYDGDAPMGGWFDEASGYTSTWEIFSDGSTLPIGYTGSATEVDASGFSDDASAVIQASQG